MTLFLLFSSILVLISLGYLLFKSDGLTKWKAVVLAISAPLLVLIIYQKIGTPEAFSLQVTAPVSQQTEQSAQNIEGLLSENQLGPEQIQQAISSLQAKIEKDPNDLDSLNLLANTYLITEQAQLAVLTLEKTIALGQNDADTLVKTADAYAFVEQGVINLRAQQLLDLALKQNPNHPQGLWLAGMEAVQSENYELAKTYWNQLLPQIAGTPQEQQLKSILAELEQQKNTDVIPLENNQTDKKVASKTTIKVTVSIGSNLRKNNPDIKDDHSVFVFAQAENGPKAPLAARRLTISDLPATITLTEKDAMLPQMTIAQFEDVILSAKISKTGDPSNKLGDIESQPLKVMTSNQEEDYQLQIQ